MIESPSNRSMHDTRCLKPGVILKERYKIEEVIGAGGFGITYLAWDPVLQAHVAIKEYYPSGIATRRVDSSQVCVPVGSEKKEFHRGLVRFLKEAQDVARFQSEPNIVSIYDYLEENETAYMVMEYLHGCTLKQFLRMNQEKINVDYLIHIGLSVLDALCVVHKAGMIHRDISPENVFICEDLTVKLIDFGAAKQVYMDREQTISVVLKPGYAPPEQYAGKDKQGPWTDIYALGATLYYVAAGEKPEESLSRLLDDSVLPVSQKNKEIPKYLSDIIMKAMSLDIKDRFETAEGMRDAVLHRSSECAGTFMRKTAGRTRKWLIVTVIGLAVASVSGWVWHMQKQKPGKPVLPPETATVSDVATALDADASPSDSSTATDAGGKKDVASESDAENTKRDDTNIMHIPENRDVLTITSSKTEGVSLDGFEYWQDRDAGMQQGFIQEEEGQPGGHTIEPYVGDCAHVTLKYLDAVQALSPGRAENQSWTNYTFRKKEDDGTYKGIFNSDGDWGFYDYSVWYTPGVTIWTDRTYLDIPLADCLEDGDYQVVFEYGETRNGEVEIQNLFKATIEFTLYRGE